MSYSPAPSESFITSPTQAARPKRRFSNAASAAQFELSDHDEDDYSKPRSKRNRASALHGRAGSPFEDDPSATAGSINSEFGSNAARGAVPKALSEKEKEARRQARMIRNRNAAQASRDRKKEHTAFLERRVAELEARLHGTAPHPLAVSSYTASGSPAPSSHLKLSRSQRSNSVTSSGSSSSNRMADLEEENELLKNQLHLEQAETARLRARVASLESAQQHLAAISTTTTPFAAYEPTFAFDTADLKPLPQPEELAFLEEHTSPSPPRLVGPSRLELVDGEPGQLSPRSTRGRFIPAAEAAPLPSSSSVPLSFDRSPSLSASISSTPSSVASLDLASTPPSTESYLEDLDNLAPPPMWNEWVKIDPSSTKDEDDSNVTSGLAFVDFSFLNDGPVVASEC
ncbi:bZIP transcription factor [Sporobolomyces koalae]|uniref:bZIP transcription factor n=1 Tax=Sporobolomyces koalae TaxID=500713 RepID=UPI00317DD17D